ncbi:YlbL family protein [Actinocorallia populi]|uniref:YlbL family protein n=1 Tax=Actinocorallia populi TaxID=2079200 RepID=UPI000D088863|nr:PDZ domain-containing protein [Actinocorallia populi]
MVNLEKGNARRPHRRALTLGLVAVLVLALAVAGAVMPVPYVSLRPGPTMNTIGANPETDKPLIEITGAQTHPASGHLNFTTVAYTGGPKRPISLFTALRDWLNGERAVVPQETIFPKDETVEEVEEENTFLMEDSQQTSVAAALIQMGQKPTTVSAVQSVEKGLPADGVLRPGDEILAVAGTKADRTSRVTGALKQYKPGQSVELTIRRDGKEQRVSMTLAPAPDDANRAVIGVVLRDRYVFPIDVKISVGDIGGPSAGLMFSLGIYDLLTPGDLTGGKFVAGTGTITPEGQVGAIGGIQQKMLGARKAGATVFLVPAGNCDEAVTAAPDGLRLVKAETLDGAVKALQSLQSGQGAVPGCSAS